MSRKLFPHYCHSLSYYYYDDDDDNNNSSTIYRKTLSLFSYLIMFFLQEFNVTVEGIFTVHFI